MDRLVNSLLLIIVSLILITGCSSREAEYDTLPKAGVAIYNFSDTYMSSIRSTINSYSKGKINLEIVDSQNSQQLQNDKVDSFISKNYTAMAVSTVDRNAAGAIIQKAQEANIPVIFINREPLADVLYKWEKAYYVGAKAEESGTKQGEIVVDYWYNHAWMDKNNDGIMQYVMLKGEPGHQDAELRTRYSILAIEEAGIPTEALVVDTAMWNRLKGQEKMASFIQIYGDKIEAVLANNDDMALGAIEALKQAGYFNNGRIIPVVGVDALEPAVKAVQEGTMIGTVYTNAENQAKATVELMRVLAAGEVPTQENIGYEITDGKYIWIPYQKLTANNQ